MKRSVSSYIKINKVIVLLSLFFILFIIGRASFIALSPKINDIDLQKFASGRNTNKQTLVAKRGTIYDKNGNVLAQTVSSYTVIAYLDPRISEDRKKPLHVINKEMTAEKLAPVLNMSEAAILSLLQRDGAYQVELGPGGRGITELVKEEIELLELPGIDFIPSYKRYYPNGSFLSYTLGYAKTDETGDIIGEFGLELFYDDLLKGENGYLEFQQDRLGYKIPNTPEIRKEPTEGKDIYLTIDNNIQLFVEKGVKKQFDYAKPEWLLMVVADAKTGAILANASYPTYDPNIRNITQYQDPLVSYAYEPGSTMKIFTYMAAIENNKYDGNDTFLTGNISIGPDTVRDWNTTGWGTITYDEGFLRSSNVGIANLTQKYINRKILLEYYKKLGFGERTGITIPRELIGKMDFYYPLDVANAGFGQGITTTPIQHIKALTSVANNGELLNPYIIEKIIGSNDEIEHQGKKESLGYVASKKTIDKIKDLMYGVVHDEIGTGLRYKIDGYDLIGKTGTAQIAGPGGYLRGGNDYIYSFSGMFPKDNPEIIVYVAMKKPTYGNSTALRNLLNEVLQNIANYLGIVSMNNNTEEIINYTMPSFINKKINNVEVFMNKKNTEFIILGEGDKVINQYPKYMIETSSKERVLVLTNDKNIIMPNIKGWSLRDVLNLTDLLKIDYEIEGYGSVISQSIAVGTIIKGDDKLIITLEPRYNLDGN